MSTILSGRWTWIFENEQDQEGQLMHGRVSGRSPVASLIVNHHHPLRNCLALLFLRSLAFLVLLVLEWHRDLQVQHGTHKTVKARIWP